MSTTEIPDAAVDAAYEALYGQHGLEGKARATVRVQVRHALEAAAPHLLSDPGAKKLGPFVAKSDTSRLAALAAYPHTHRDRRRVLLELDRAGERGRTRDEIAEALQMNPNTVRPRVAELRDGGWLEVVVGDDGKPVRRKAVGGGLASVVRVSAMGRRRLAAQKAA